MSNKHLNIVRNDNYSIYKDEKALIDLIDKLLEVDPNKRITP